MKLIIGKRRPPPRKKPPPSPDDFTEDFKELVRANIIKDYPLNSLNDWIGDRSYQNYEAILEFRNYKHRLGEVKQLVMEYCILPLSTKEIHQIAPLIQSVCICGLPQQGKTFLVNAICSEVFSFFLQSCLKNFKNFTTNINKFIIGRSIVIRYVTSNIGG